MAKGNMSQKKDAKKPKKVSKKKMAMMGGRSMPC